MRSKYTVHERDAEPIQLTRRVVRPLITQGSGARNAVMYTGVYEAGKRMPAHIHETVEEMIYVLSGRGEVTVDGTTEPIEPGSSIFLPAGSTHFLNVLGDQPLHIVFVFSPPEVPGRYQETLT